MNEHESASRQMLGPEARELRLSGTMTLHARRAGWLLVETGQVWITMDGGGSDLVLGPGESIWVGRGQRLLAEAWRHDVVSRMGWRHAQPQLQPRPGAVSAWRLAAGALAWAAGRLAQAARGAEAMASQAQGCLKAGDSMATSGAHQ